jgi:hypothetical protein
LKLILSERVTLILSNLTLFVFGAVGVWKLGHRLLGIPWASAALVLFAFWPNYIAGVASPEKEQLVASLIPWALFLFLRTMTDQRPLASALFGGACLGAACLVQPSLQLLPLVLLCCAVAIGADDSRRRIVACMVFFLAIIAVIAPWTLRNYQIFHRVILITTSAGDNLYRANNPLATGTYTERGSIDLSGLPELQKNDRGRQLALEWIKSNPGRFALLAVKKTLFFMCDDSYAIYSSLKVGKGSDSPLVYLLFKGISTLFWLIFWTYLFVVLVEVWTRGVPGSPAALILPMTFLYLVLIHAIFESQGKYHTPLVGVTALLLPLYLSRVARGRRADRPMPRAGATCEPAVS